MLAAPHPTYGLTADPSRARGIRLGGSSRRGMTPGGQGALDSSRRMGSRLQGKQSK